MVILEEWLFTTEPGLSIHSFFSACCHLFGWLSLLYASFFFNAGAVGVQWLGFVIPFFRNIWCCEIMTTI